MKDKSNKKGIKERVQDKEMTLEQARQAVASFDKNTFNVSYLKRWLDRQKN